MWSIALGGFCTNLVTHLAIFHALALRQMRDPLECKQPLRSAVRSTPGDRNGNDGECGDEKLRSVLTCFVVNLLTFSMNIR
ncbi:hypothetical protein [Microcoleus sp. B4-D4]|uniref:hypothetical protein n=1 Tax=Microcoleus sp. B4-D4 TaxID=2818667 RepID=UPI002FD157A4